MNDVKRVVGPCRHDNKQAFGFSPKTGSEAWYLLVHTFSVFWWTTWYIFLVVSEQEMRRAVELTLLCGLGLTALVDPAAGFVPGRQCATKRAGYDSGDWLRQRTTTSAPPRRISSSSSSSSLETSTTSDEYEVSCVVGC